MNDAGKRSGISYLLCALGTVGTLPGARVYRSLTRLTDRNGKWDEKSIPGDVCSGSVPFHYFQCLIF